MVLQSTAVTREYLASAKAMVTSPCSSPAVLFVDRTADLKLAARCTVTARFAFGGSSVCAPVAVLVHEAVEGVFSAHLLEFLKSFLATRDDLKESQLHSQASRKGKPPPPQNGTVETEVLFSDSGVEVVIIRNRYRNPDFKPLISSADLA